MIVSPIARALFGAIICALLGYLIDTFVPLPPLAHIAAIILYVLALFGVIYAGYILVFGGPGRIPPAG